MAILRSGISLSTKQTCSVDLVLLAKGGLSYPQFDLENVTIFKSKLRGLNYWSRCVSLVCTLERQRACRGLGLGLEEHSAFSCVIFGA